MPELAEVEYYRKQWDPGLGCRISRVHWNRGKRVFRGLDEGRMAAALEGAVFRGSEAKAKLICFRFSRKIWLGVHLGMSGELRVEAADFAPKKHDHLVLYQRARTLVFCDPRMFGRVQFYEGSAPPAWWSNLPPALTSDEFTEARVEAFFRRRARLAVKAALLVQSAFPGVGNWMADEILWRARLDPRTPCGRLSSRQAHDIWREAREVCSVALATVGVDFSDPPEGWLMHERWTAKGICPRDGLTLQTATIGGRTTRWCRRCQRRSHAA